MRDNNPQGQISNSSRGRPREFDEDEVMTALLDLFWNQGYDGTSLNDIMTATGLKKGSLYTLFGSKRNMYIRALMRYDRDYVAKTCVMLRDKSSGPAAGRLDEFLSLPMTALYLGNDQRGCFLCNAAAEMAAHDPDMRGFIKSCYEAMTKALTQTIKDAKATLTAEQAEGRAAMLMTVYSGLRIMARSGSPRAYMDSAKNAALDLI